MHRITAELTKAECTNFPTHRSNCSMVNDSKLTTAKQSMMKYRKSLKDSGNIVRKSQDGNPSNSFNVESKGNVRLKKGSRKKGNSETPMQ